MTKLYHKDVYMPDGYKVPCWRNRLMYSRHALDASRNDRYGYIDLPNWIDYDKSTVIEVETSDDVVIKQVWRTTYDDTRDLILVVTNTGIVKTVWINVRTDKHTTLDVSKYERK